MAFSHKPSVRLGGATQREASREETLRKAKEERAARQGAKRLAKAALIFQSAWRGRKLRAWLRRTLADQWLADFSAVAADASQLLPAEALRDKVLPPVLLLFLPPTGPRRAALARGGRRLELPAGVGIAPLRGALALVMRGVGAPQPGRNYLSLHAQADGRLADQAGRLALLCVAIIGGEAEQLTQSAALRLLLRLTDAKHWRAGVTSEEAVAAAQAGCLALCRQLSAQPLCFQMVSHLVTAPAAAASSQLQDGLAILLRVLPTAPDSGAGGDHAAALHMLVQHVLSAPGLAASAPTVARAALSDGALLRAVMAALPGCALCDPLTVAANLTELVAGARPAAGMTLPKSGVLQSQGAEFATAYLRALERLLAEAARTSGPDALLGLPDLLWPLAQRSHALQLLKVGGESALPAFVRLYSLLLGKSLRRTAGGKAQLPFLNCLAFAPSLLPKLWAWLATTIGMPRDSPAEATSGWNIRSLRKGGAGLANGPAAALGLFCRLLAHLLLVLDDSDFHEHQDPFPLAVSRGVATALNCLVFCSHVPVETDVKPAPVPPGDPLLAEWAPVALRSIYERDLRRPFCPPSMWLAPYVAVTEGEDASSAAAAKSSVLLLPFGARPPPPVTNFSAPAVVRALSNMLDGAGAPSSVVDDFRAGAAQQPRRFGVPPSQLASLLLAAPHCVPFAQRVEVFRALVAADREQHNRGTVLRLKVRRSCLLDEAYRQLGRVGSGIKARLDVTFLNEQGLQEAGLDYGGLMKDFIEDVVRAGFNPDYGLFVATREGQLHPGPQAVHMDQGPGLLQFLGLMVGKAMYEGMLIDLPLAPFFILRLQGRRPLFDDLQLLDEEIYRSLVSLKQYEGDCEDMGLDFTIEEETFGKREEIELVPGGGDLPVTNTNRLHYVALVADWHLNGGTRGAAAAAFARGLGQVVPLSWLTLFSPKELNEVVGGGTAGDLDVEDMRSHTKYSGGYSESSSTVKLFWKVVEGFSPGDRAALLKFVTSCSRAPLGGFAFMNPPFTIHKVPCAAPLMAVVAGRDVDRLPSASTCYNTLKLPNFRRAATMREKLLYSIHSGAGFELS